MLRDAGIDAGDTTLYAHIIKPARLFLNDSPTES